MFLPHFEGAALNRSEVPSVWSDRKSAYRSASAVFLLLQDDLGDFIIFNRVLPGGCLNRTRDDLRLDAAALGDFFFEMPKKQASREHRYFNNTPPAYVCSQDSSSSN